MAPGCFQAARQNLSAVSYAARQGGEAGIRTLFALCCDRIDYCEPHIRALLPEPCRRERLFAASCNPTVLGGPLGGLLVGVKDIIAAEGFPTKCGTAVPAELHQLPTEAEVVRRLRAAGAVVAGKTVTTEFASSDPAATANPWSVGHTPGGSSSGSAAAVAAGEVHIGIGTQTIGSVCRPGAFCGICAFKPTFGRVPTVGIAIYSPSIDTLGFFTPDMEGMATVSALAVDSWNASALAQASSRAPILGVPEGPYLNAFSTISRVAFEEALEDLSKAGVTIRRVPCVLEDWHDVVRRHEHLTKAEWARSLSNHWQQYGSLFRAQSAMLMVQGLAVTETQESVGREGRGALCMHLEQTMDTAGIDLWVTPGTFQGPAPLGLASTGNALAQLPWSHAGLPAIALPAGLVQQRLPVALQLAARSNCDEAMLGWCSWLERCGVASAMRCSNMSG